MDGKDNNTNPYSKAGFRAVSERGEEVFLGNHFGDCCFPVR